MIGGPALRNRPFRWLVGGQLASNLGDAFYLVALPWYVLTHHGDAVLLGEVLAAYGIARTATILVGGQLADRLRPWSVMLGADLCRAVAVGALAVVAGGGPARLAVVAPIAAVLGAGEGIFLPASMTVIPRLLPGDAVQAGTGLSTAGQEAAALAGPAAGGAVVALAGAAPAFAVDAASFVLSAITLAVIRAALRAPNPATVTPEESTEPVAEGSTGPGTVLGLLRSNRAWVILLVVVVAANFGTGALFQVALPALARGPFHAGAGGFGGLEAALGGGALIGSLAAARSRGRKRPMVVASSLFLFESVLTAAAPYLGGPVPAGVALAVFGACNAFGNVLAFTVLQREAPPSLLGRAMSLVFLAALGVYPLSVVVGGFLVRAWGPAACFPAAGGLLAVAVLAGLSQSAWRRFGAVDDRVPATA